MDTAYGIPLQDWAKGKDEMRAILMDVAHQERTITYSELVERIRHVRFEPDSHALAAMLGEISSEEHDEGRGMLSVVVVHKTGDMKPGKGFFELARRLGRDVSDPDVRWISELKSVWEYWQTPGRARGADQAGPT